MTGEQRSVDATDAATMVGGEPRNIIARGMQRFEIGKVAPPQPDWEHLSPRVVCVLGQNPASFTLNGTNCYIVGTGRRRMLIDTGEQPMKDPTDTSWGNVKMMPILKQCMREIGCDGFSHILVTHLHHDHFGGVDAILDAFPGPTSVAMIPVPSTSVAFYTLNEVEKRGLTPYLEKGPSPYNDPANPMPPMPRTLPNGKSTRPNLPDGRNPFMVWRQNWRRRLADATLPDWPDEDLSWDMYGRTKRELQQEFHGMQRHFEFYMRWHRGALPRTVLSDGDVLRTEGATLRVMHTPGHAENHAMFILEEEEAVFSGDHVLGYGTTVLHDLRDYMATLHRVLALRPGRLYPGHGPYIADGTGLLERYCVHRQQREDQVAAHLGEADTPLRAIDIVDALYVNTSDARKPQARDNVEKILHKLVRDGKASCWERPDVPATLPSHGYGATQGPANSFGDALRWTLTATATK